MPTTTDVPSPRWATLADAANLDRNGERVGAVGRALATEHERRGGGGVRQRGQRKGEGEHGPMHGTSFLTGATQGYRPMESRARSALA